MQCFSYDVLIVVLSMLVSICANKEYIIIIIIYIYIYIYIDLIITMSRCA